MKKHDFETGMEPWDSTDPLIETKIEFMKAKIMGWKDLPDSMKEEIFKRFLHFQENQPQRSETECDVSMDFAGLKWAVKDSDLNFVEALAASSLAIATYLTAVTGANPVVMAVSLVFSAWGLYRRLLKKIPVLYDEQYKILMALKASGPSTVEELSKNLSGLHIFGNDVWTEERTLESRVVMKERRIRGCGCSRGALRGLTATPKSTPRLRRFRYEGHRRTSFR